MSDNKNNLDNIIQDISEIKKLTEERGRLDANKSIEDLRAYNETIKKNNINITSWISIIIGFLGLIITLAASYGTLRLTMQDYFNDIDNFKKELTSIEEQIEKNTKPLTNIFNTVDNLNYRVSIIEDDIDPLDEYYNSIKNFNLKDRIISIEKYINNNNLQSYKLEKLLREFEQHKQECKEFKRRLNIN